MARNLYRVYLYTVTLALLIFGAVATALLAGRLLSQTSLHGPYNSAASRAQVVQAAVFAVVAWLLIGALGGLHYWLIRLDIRSDPSAAGGGVRAFFLNVVEAGAVLAAVFPLASSVSRLGFLYGDASGSLAAGCTALAVAIVLELERRRAAATTRVALVFQRLHLYGVPFLVLLILASSAWMTAVQLTLAQVLIHAGKRTNICAGSINCGLRGTAAQWGAVGIVALVFVVYVLLVRRDIQSRMRYVFHLLSFTYGVIFLLIGLDRGVELGLRQLLGVADFWTDITGSYAFLPTLSFGLLVTTAYAYWLRSSTTTASAEASASSAWLYGIAAGLFAIPFWVGCGTVLYLVVEQLVPASSRVETALWASTVALVLTGIGYIPLVRYLGRNARAGMSLPHRALVFVLLAAGTVTTVIGAAIVLYTGGTSLLGEPVSYWQELVRGGLVVLVIGASVAGLHLRIALRHHYFGGHATKPEPTLGEATPTA